MARALASSDLPHLSRHSAVIRAASALLRGRRLGLALIILLFLLWEISARTGLVQSTNWPPISAVFLAGIHSLQDGELLTALGGTLYRMAAGFVCGAAAGIIVGMLMGASRIARLFLEPTIELLRPMPVPAIIPPLILFLGSADPMKITIVAFSVFFPVLVNTLQGSLSIEPTYRGVAATFDSQGSRPRGRSSSLPPCRTSLRGCASASVSPSWLRSWEKWSPAAAEQVSASTL